jgi:DNA-binding NarL/FixJ family response regulator
VYHYVSAKTGLLPITNFEHLTKIIIYEDNEDMRDSLSYLVEHTEGFSLAGAFTNCKEAAKQVVAMKPDLVLMDIEMPEVNGIDGIIGIRQFDKDLKIVVLTVFEDNQNVFAAICAGANGYLLKKSSGPQVIAGINDALAGGAPMSSSIASKVLRLLADNNLNAQQKNDYGLTTREKQILQSLVQGNSYKMIAGIENISVDTVKTHLKRIYHKLQVHSQTEAVIKAIRDRIV